MLKAREKLGKYRIERRLARGGFAEVYQAFDTLEGVAVALKIPFVPAGDREAMLGLREEVRITASLDHENILPIKNAEFIGNLLLGHAGMLARPLPSVIETRHHGSILKHYLQMSRKKCLTE